MLPRMKAARPTREAHRRGVRWARRGLLAGLLAAAMIAHAPRAHGADEILVFAAASMAAPIDDAIRAFAAGAGARVRGVYAGTSTLARQIEQGAPASLFISANEAWMDYVAERGLIEAASRVRLVGNRLVLIAPADSALPDSLRLDDDWATLVGDRRLAVGDPAHVPVGIYTAQALRALGHWPVLHSKLAPAADVRGVTALVARGEAPLGVVYASDLGLSGAVRAVATIPSHLHDPITYSAALIEGGASPLARRFLDFLLSPEAREIFARHGFTTDLP